MTRVTMFTETRTVTGFHFTPKSHLFFDGMTLRLDRQKFNRSVKFSGRLRGTVKVTVLANGNISLKSLATKGGDGTLVHLDLTATMVIDGEEVELGTWVLSETLLNSIGL